MLAALLGLTGCAGSEPGTNAGIRASDAAAVVARGRYLVRGPAHCGGCHGAPEGHYRRDADGYRPLSGGRRFDLGPLGTVVAPNITSDPVAGIGAWPDEVVVHSLRYGIGHDGRTLAPIMPFADMTDRDLRAVISYLRTVAPVPAPAPRSRLTWLGVLVLGLLAPPASPDEPPLDRLAPAATADYGRYLAHVVANCHGCHTRRSRLTGRYTGPAFAGGMALEEAGSVYVTPNLTPVPGGVLDTMTEREFIRYVRVRAPDASPMPWRAYGRMTDTDLAALFRYLKSLPEAKTPT